MEMENEPVIVPAIILSDMVVREQGTRKLSLIGSFQGFTFQKFPVKFSRFFATATISNLRGKDQLKVVARVELESSGHVLGSSSGTITVKDPDVAMHPDDVVDMVFPFSDIVFSEPGKHSVVVLINNYEIGRRHFFVRSITTVNVQQ